ncbi:E3 ubiquitin-protein ligase [Musa troglodytarum]|uniref:E3 ubiquitin-protein ligase n=1 Tax=Musa troglodytarum TaxID=320322 RepID=A0A9E7HRE7_9LILI|nr:E3 ubiquitin-protein ligase [Musa troglodytarum]
MDETAKIESHLSSAVAFMEGGIHDACDDACSICLEAFCESDPSTGGGMRSIYSVFLNGIAFLAFSVITVLPRCQRSSQCPMCWQPTSLKDPTSQELPEAVEWERSFRLDNTQTTTIIQHPAFGDFELQHLPVGGSHAEIEECIFQHLLLLLPWEEHTTLLEEKVGLDQDLMAVRDAASVASISSSSPPRGGNEVAPAIVAANPTTPTTTPVGEFSELTSVTPTHASEVATLTSEARNSQMRSSISCPRAPAGQSSRVHQDGPGPSDFQSFSGSLKSRLNAVSMRYKESITKSTQGWRERLFSRNGPVADIGSEVRREISVRIAIVSRMMECLDARERTACTSASPVAEGCSVVEGSNDGDIANNARSERAPAFNSKASLHSLSSPLIRPSAFRFTDESSPFAMFLAQTILGLEPSELQYR